MKTGNLIGGAAGSLLLLTAGNVCAQAPLPVLKLKTGSLRCEISFNAAAGCAPLIEASNDLLKWRVKGAPAQPSPGSFLWADSSPISSARLFYRSLPEPPPAEAAWLKEWSAPMLGRTELALPPELIWAPFPGSGPVSYRFEFCEAADDGDGGLMPLYPALAEADALTDAAFIWPQDGVWPAAGGRYVCRVTAVSGIRCWEGHWQPMPGIAVTDNRVRGIFSAPAPRVERDGVVVDWNRIIKVMNEITEKKNEIKKKLSENELIRQLELIRRLKDLFGGLGAAKDALDSWLGGPVPTPPSAGQVLEALCFLDSAGELMLKLDKKMPASLKASLRRFTDRVHEYKTLLKQAIENHSDTAGLIQLIMNQLRALLQESRFDGTGLWDYIVGWVKDKAMEKLKEVLEEELGKKAAGALLSILQDIYSFLDGIENLDDLKALCLAYNKTVLAAIAAGRWPLPADWEYFCTVKEADLGCDFVIRPYKRCFVRTADSTDPTDGDWEKTTVHFTDGSTSKRGSFRTSVQQNNHDGTYNISFPFDLADADLTCPPGSGPCLLLAEVCVICPGVSSRRDGCYHFFIQPLPCP